MKRITIAGAAAIALGVIAVSADDLGLKLEALEKRIAELEAAKPAANRLEASWRPGLWLASSDKAVQLRIGGRIQNDWSFAVDTDDALESKVGAFDDTIDFRRLWLEFDGTLYDRTYYSAHIDFVGGKTGVRNVFLGVKDVPVLGRVQVGSQQEPFGLEEITSNNNITFLERPLALFYPSYNAGIRALRTLLNDRMTVSAGLFRDTDDNGRIASDDGYNATARLTGAPVLSDDGRRLVHLGIASSLQRTPAGTAQYRGRPENRWQPFFVSVTNIPADEASLAGLEFASVYGPLSLQAEWNMAAPDTEGDDPEFSGYYAQVSYFLTGEHRPYEKTSGCFGRVTPKRNFGREGWGAWEIAFRVSGVDLTDGAYTGGEMQNYTAGVNWYLNPSVRMMLNYVSADLDTVGASDSVVARFQVAF